MSALQMLAERVFPAEFGLSVSILGDCEGGKSTIVAALEWRRGFTSSLGINRSWHGVPTFPNNRRFLFHVLEPAGLDCEDPRTIGLVWTRLIAATLALIWVVDSTKTSPGEIERNRDALTAIVNSVQEEKRRQGHDPEFPVLILANKQDVPGALSIDDIRRTFQPFTYSHISSLMPTCATKSYEEGGLHAAMGWLDVALGSDSLMPTPETLKFETTSKYSRELIDRVISWVERLKEDVDDEEFINLFYSFKLPSWDHYTHIRIAYLLLKTYGRQEGKDRIFEGLNAYISQSPASTNRVFNVTWTYFWIQMVYLGIQIQKLELEMATQSGETTIIPQLLPSLKKEIFAHFLLLNPYVADSSWTLWGKYYSLDRWKSPWARSSMVLPDKQTLPNVVIRDAL